MDYLPIEGTSKIVKDRKTSAVLNVDNTALDAYKAQRSRRNRVDTMEDDINSIKTQINDIHDMLSRLVK